MAAEIEPAEAEARGIETIDIKYRNEVFTFPASMDDAPLSVLEAFDEQKFSHVVRGLLSEADYQKLIALPDVRIKDLGELFTEYTKVSGQNPGE